MLQATLRHSVGKMTTCVGHLFNLVGLGKLDFQNFYRLRYLLFCLRNSLLCEINRLPDLRLRPAQLPKNLDVPFPLLHLLGTEVGYRKLPGVSNARFASKGPNHTGATSNTLVWSSETS